MSAHPRQLVARVHELADLEQLAAEVAAGMQALEVVAREALDLEQRHGEGVAQRQRRGRRGGGRQLERAGLAVDRRRQVDVGQPATALSALPVMATIGMPRRCRISARRTSSSVEPE